MSHDLHRGASNFIDVLEHSASTGDVRRLAFVFLPDGSAEGARITYSQLLGRAWVFSSWLAERAGPGSRVVLAMEPGLDYIVALLACMYARVIAVPAAPVKRGSSATAARKSLRLTEIVRSCEPSALLCSPGAAVLQQLSDVLPVIDVSAGMRLAMSQESIPNLPACTASPGTIALLQYTSGSTASPKGVILTHGNILHNQALIQSVFCHTPTSIIAGWLPMFHDMGLIGNVLNTLYSGAQAILFPPTAFIQKPLRWLEVISRYRATTSGGPNFAYELCAAKGLDSSGSALDLSCWTTAFVGAEPIRAGTLQRFGRAFAPVGFDVRAFLPCYGLAESTLIVSANPRSSPVVVREFARATLQEGAQSEGATMAPAPGESAYTLVSSGAPLVDQHVVIVDPEARQPCADGRVGEVWVSGGSVGQGYWNNEKASSEAFQAHLASFPGQTYLRTGDLALLSDGQLFVCGRLKDRFKLRGRSYYASDIEQLAGEVDVDLAACGAAAFLALSDEMEQIILVQEVPRSGAKRDLAALASQIRASILEYLDLRLDVVAFALAGTLPRTSSGKIRRRECRDAFSSGTLELLGEFRAPALPTTQHDDFASEWKHLVFEKLGVAESGYDSAMRLSELGVDSLAMASLHERVCKELHVDIPLAEFMQLETLGEVLARLAQLSAQASSTGRRIESAMSLSRGQQSLYYIQKAYPATAAYNISRAFALDTALHPAAFGAAVRRLLRRHPMLTCRFGLDAGQLWQSPNPHAPLPVTHVDLSIIEEDRLAAWMAAEHLRPIDLHRGPPFRVLILRARERTVVMFKMHHIVCDLWSLSILWQELAALYEEQLSGTSLSLGSGAAYSEFVSSQEAFLRSAAAARQQSYWQKQLAGPLAPLQLPPAVVEISTPPDQSDPAGVAQTLELTLDAAVLKRFTATCVAHNATLFMGLLAVTYAVLSRVGNQRDLIIGAPVASRKAARWRQTVGYFVNTLPLRLCVASNETFRSLLEQARQTVLMAYEHADYPFALIASHAAGTADLFQVMLVMQSLPNSTNDLSAVAVGRGGAHIMFGRTAACSVSIPDTTSQAPIMLLAAQLPGGQLALSFRYRRTVLDEEMAARIASYLQAVIRWAPDHLNEPIGSTPPLSAGQSEEVLRRFNATAVDFGAAAVLHQLILECSQRTPVRTAVRAGTRTLTYRDLNDLAEAAACGLIERGVRCDEVVGVYANRSIESIVAMLAILKAGAAFLPLDPDHPPERQRFMLQDAGVQWLLAGAPTEAPHLNGAVQIATLETLRGRPEAAAARAALVHPTSLAYVLYTSGSTGTPKGVAIPHEAICNRLLWMQDTYRLNESDRVLHKTPASFDVSVWEIFWPLTCGATVVLAPAGTHRDVAALHRLMQEADISVAHFVPSVARVFLDPDIATAGSVPLRLLVCSGEELTPEILVRARRAGILSVSNQYGPTEAAIDVSSWDWGHQVPSKVPIGRPIANLALYILDESMRPVPVGMSGEIYIGGRGLGRGYIGKPGLTAQAFLPDPYALHAGARLYKTGDLGRRRADGVIDYLGRRDEQVKLHGVRIELGEIESLLMQEESVTAAAAAVRAGQLVAWIVPRSGTQFDPVHLRARLERRLPAAMLPHDLVPIAELPLTGSGKVNRAALQSLELPSVKASSYVPPSTPVEQVLAEIWSVVLKRPHLGIDDNFFTCGGDSILSIQVAALARARGYEVPLDALYRHQTIRLLAPRLRCVEAAPADDSPAPFSLVSERDKQLLPPHLADAYPMSQLQQALLFHDQRLCDYEIYTTSLRVHERLDEALLQEAFAFSITRHPMLRTTFNLDVYSEPMQLVHLKSPASLTVLDLSELGAKEQNSALSEWLLEERKRRFDWTKSPLVRLTAHLRSQADFQLTLSEPFLDGWSVATLLTEVLGNYKSLLDGGQPVDTTPLAATYSDFIALERQAMDSAECKEFWRARISGMAPSRLLCSGAFGTRRESVQRLEHSLEEHISKALQAVAARLGLPLKAVFAAAHAKVAGLFSGTDHVTFGIVCNGRPVKKDGERTLGAHLNTLPCHINLRHRTWEQIIRDCFAFENDSLAYRRYPISELQRAHHRTPLFDTMFNFTHFHVYREIAARTGLRISQGYASEQTYYPLTTQCHVDHGGSQMTVAFDYLPAVPSELVEEFATCFLDALRSICREAPAAHTQRAAPRGGEHAASSQEAAQIDFLRRIVEHARTRPDKAAVQCPRASLSYRELVAAAQRIAAALIRQGVGPEDRVAVHMERSSYLVASLLGVLLAGGAYVPIDMTQPAGRVDKMLKQVAPRVILADAAAIEELNANICVLAADEIVKGHRHDAPVDPDAHCFSYPARLAYLIFTSGSTGTPKSVAVSCQSLQNLIHWHREEYQLTERDRISQVASFGFDASVWEIWPALTVGATLHIAPRAVTLDPAELRFWLHDHDITSAFLPTPLFELFMTQDCSGTSLRHVLTGGDLLHRYPAAALPFEVINHYGPAENTVVATAARLAENSPRGPVPPIGRAILNNRVLLLDVFGAEARAYVPGEIHIAGSSLARGYWNDPAGTALRFVPEVNPPTPGTRMYRTGDLAYRLSDAALYFIGRADAQIKLRGVRIEIGEIEAALARHPRIAQATVVLRENASPGNESQLVAYVASTDNLEPGEVKAHLRKSLPEIMVPTHVIVLERLPLTRNGKVDRTALPVPQQEDADTTGRAPLDPTSREIANVWEAVLGRSQITLGDNFFDIGGHSLLATQVVSRLRRAFGVPIPISMVFEHPTLERFAAEITQLCIQHAGADRVQSALQELERLSDEQVEELLARTTAANNLNSHSVREGPRYS